MNHKSKTEMSYNAQKVNKTKLISNKLNAQNLLNYFSLVVGGALIVLMLGVVTLLVPPARDNAKASGKHYTVHIVAGQSNAVGFGSYQTPLVSDTVDSNIKLYYNEEQNMSSNDSIVGLQSQYWPDLNVSMWGPEISLARNLYRQGNQNILIIKIAHGGTSLWEDWRSPDGPQYKLLTSGINSALSKISNQGDTYSVDGFYWIQGEDDANPNGANYYGQNLQKLITNVRTMSGNANLPVVLERIKCNTDYCKTPDDLETVRNTQVYFGNNYSRVRWVNTDDLPTVDGLHIDASGLTILGERLFDEISPFMQAKYPSLIPSDSYTDVSAASAYKPAIGWSVSRKIIFPYSSTIFRPNETVTRAKIVQFIWRAKGSPRATISSNFADVPTTANYKPALDWAKQAGVISGDSMNKFYPNNVTTRQQYIDMLWKYSGSKTPNPNTTFSDVYESSKSFKPSINWSNNYGIVSTSNNKYLPTSSVTRQQAAYYLYNLSKNEEAWLDRNTAPASVLF